MHVAGGQRPVVAVAPCRSRRHCKRVPQVCGVMSKVLAVLVFGVVVEVEMIRFTEDGRRACRS